MSSGSQGHFSDATRYTGNITGVPSLVRTLLYECRTIVATHLRSPVCARAKVLAGRYDATRYEVALAFGAP